MKRYYYLLLAIALFSSVVSHETNLEASELPDNKKTFKTIADVPQSSWDNLATKKIYFGHHSVGKNIFSGLAVILKEHPNIKLNIIKAKSTEKTLKESGLYESGVGKNFQPFTKVASFKEKMENGYGASADIAFFKFCFVDFNPETDIKKLFNEYQTTMDEIRKEYPQTIFPSVTVPLSCYAPGLRGVKKRAKSLVKKIIGKVNTYDYSSANRFNELLQKRYAGEVPIFDLARIESTRADGSRVIKEKDGVMNYELVQEYTTDGGHLNSKGKKILAEQFLLFLVELADSKK